MKVSLFNENYVKQNSMRAWWLAARPKTLSGAAVPVMIGGAFAYNTCPDYFLLTTKGGLGWGLCLLFAWLMQIDSNFINDYWDCKKGRDNEERLGPLRACQQRWISLRAMVIGIVITTLLACAVGLPLIYFGGIEMIYVGLACVIFSALYTVCLAQWGLGDVLVLLFFGIVPVCGTYWCCVPADMQQLNMVPWWYGIATGLIVDTLLIVNNYRDIDNDRNSGKKTIVVLLGKKNTEYLYLALVTAALLLVMMQYDWSAVSMIVCFGSYFLYTTTWNKMKTYKGKELNKVLGETARNIFVFGILTSILILVS